MTTATPTKRSHPLLVGEYVIYIDEENVEHICVIEAHAEEDDDFQFILAEVDDKGEHVYEPTGARFGVNDDELHRYSRFKLGEQVIFARDVDGDDLQRPQPVRLAGITAERCNMANSHHKQRQYITCPKETPDETIEAHTPDQVKDAIRFVYDHQLDPVPKKTNLWTNDRAIDEGWALGFQIDENGDQCEFYVSDASNFKGEYALVVKHLKYWHSQGSTYHETALKLIGVL